MSEGIYYCIKCGQRISLSHRADTCGNCGLSYVGQVFSALDPHWIDTAVPKSERGRFVVENDTLLRYYAEPDTDHVLVPSYIKTIGQNVFSGYQTTKSVELSTGVEVIDKAFQNCFLDRVILPDSITSMKFAFSSSGRVPSIVRQIQLPKTLKRIDEGAFSGCVLNEGVLHLPDSIEAIDECAFEHSNLKSVHLPAGLRRIGNHAFAHTNLAEITVPESLTEIQNYAFSHCGQLTVVNMPKTIRHIGEGAFSHCKNLQLTAFPDDLEEIGEEAFAFCNSLSSITLPKDVTTIGRNAFRDCANIKHIFIDSHYDISYRKTAFLKEIQLQEEKRSNSSVSAQSPHDFSATTADAAFAIPMYIQRKIAEGAFSGCSDLTDITIPEDVSVIEYNAFSGCKNLKRVDLNYYQKEEWESFFYGVVDHLVQASSSFHNVKWRYPSFGIQKTIEKNAFVDCKNLEIHINMSLQNALSSRILHSINNASTIPPVVFATDYTVQGTKILKYTGDLTSVAIPEFFTSIEDNAFSGLSSLEEIKLHERITRIGQNAFSDCTSLTRIDFPDSLVEIDEQAFVNCVGLEEVSFSSKQTVIGKDAFLNTEYIKKLKNRMLVWKMQK